MKAPTTAGSDTWDSAMRDETRDGLTELLNAFTEIDDVAIEVEQGKRDLKDVLREKLKLVPQKNVTYWYLQNCYNTSNKSNRICKQQKLQDI